MNYQKTIIEQPCVIRETNGAKITSPLEVAAECKNMKNLAQENFVVITVDTKFRIINKNTVSIGTLDSCLVTPRDIFRAAIMDNAASIFLVHNHPSGDSSPSSADIKTTTQLVSAGEVLGIKVLDHIIIGRDKPEFISLRESGLVTF